MSLWPQHQDRSYLRHEQYADERNLAARADIYRRFGTNSQSWIAWVFEQLVIQPGESVLECGCGPGWLWAENAGAVPSLTRLTLTDLSTGMLATASGNLEAQHMAAELAAADIAHLPFGAARFDLVIANHMLYHVPDRRQVFAEIARVLRPGGRFVAATNGSAHLHQFAPLERAVFGDAERVSYSWDKDFSLENGAAQLAAVFNEVELREYSNELLIDDAQAVVDYIGSVMGQRDGPTPERTLTVKALVEAEIAQQGAFRVTAAPGLFIARLGG